MIETLKKYWPSKVLLALFFFFTIWWLYMTLFMDNNQSSDPLSPFGLFGNLYGITAAWSAIVGFIISRSWGGWKSLMGRAIMMFSFGLLFQEFGQLIYSYYIFILNIEIPYPSLGDIGFFGTIPFNIYGTYLLSKMTGVRLNMKSLGSKLQLILIPLYMLTVSYVFIMKDYSFDLSTPLTTFLNYGYPLGSAVYISIALLTYSLTRNSLGGVMRNQIIFLIFAFCMQFFAEFCFIFFQNSYYPGSVLDYLYMLSYTLTGLGIFRLAVTLKKLKG